MDDLHCANSVGMLLPFSVRVQLGESDISFLPSTVKDTLRQKTERIEELEEALRESVQITAEREMVLAQEEAARSLQEKQVHKHTNIAKQYL